MDILRKGNKKPKLIIKILVSLIIFGLAGFGTYSYFHIRQIENDNRIASNLRIAEEKAATEAAAAREAKRKEPVYITLPGASPIRAIVEDYDSMSSVWVLVNKKQSIPLTYEPANLVVPSVKERLDKSIEERSVRGDIADAIKTMFDVASTEGHALMIGSAYRSSTLQKTYFDSYSATAGVEAANQYSARPGESEHQTGLSIDISTVSRNCYLDECFTSTPDGQWLANNAYMYGFTLRYPKGKELITGYQFEPWHYRYVGVDLATALYKSNLTLDEAWPYLQEALKTLHENGAI